MYAMRFPLEFSLDPSVLLLDLGDISSRLLFAKYPLIIFTWLTLPNVSLFISGVNSLKCKCDICPDKNFICETDGYCFTTTFETKSGEVEHQYRYVYFV